jgi:putative ABC transport system permease protein
MRKDLTYALRSLRRQPGFTLVTILTLALGIGANTAVFSVVNGVILRPLQYPDAGRLEFITSQFPGLGFDQFWVSLPEFVEFRDRNHSFESVGAYNVGAVNLGIDPPSRPVRGSITPELLPTLGVRPVMGRWFAPADSAPGAAPVAILSYELWQRSFGGRPDILDQAVTISNVSTQIIAVMPRGFDVHDQQVEIWTPLTIDPSAFPNLRGSHSFYLVGRLKPGVSLAQAKADLEVLLQQWPATAANTHSPDTQRHRLRIDPLKEDIVGPVRTALLVLQAAVGFILLIACANLANLLIARADARMREYAVRAALGASRWHLLRQLVTEGLLLSTAGAAAGVALGWGGLSLLISVNPTAIPRTAEVSLDWRVLGFTLAVAVLTGLIFGLVPLLHLGRDQAGQALKASGNRSTTGSARSRLRSSLVVAEIALAVVLVVGAGLLIRSFINLTRVDLGFTRSSLATFGLVLPGPKYNAESRVALFDRLITSVRAIPGVQSAALMSGLPPLRQVNANDTDFEDIPDGPQANQQQFPTQNVDFWQGVTVGYAETMGIPVVKGRSFVETDATGAPVVLINEALARKFFPDRDPIGRHVKPGFGAKLPWFTIVGVLKDVKQGGVDAGAGTELYLLNPQLPRTAGFSFGQMNLVVRSSVPLGSIANGLRKAVADLDPGLPLIKMRAMDDVIDAAIARPRFLTLLLGLFAGLALVLAAVGTYGILSYLVSERKQEIGIRMALGADRRTILTLVLVRGLALSSIGLVLGLGASIGLTKIMATLLFNVQPIDPVTLASVAGVIALVAGIACLVPAWRATRVEPLSVLRES